jgi:hypothetical protein
MPTARPRRWRRPSRPGLCEPPKTIFLQGTPRREGSLWGGCQFSVRNFGRRQQTAGRVRFFSAFTRFYGPIKFFFDHQPNACTPGLGKLAYPPSDGFCRSMTWPTSGIWLSVPSNPPNLASRTICSVVVGQHCSPPDPSALTLQYFQAILFLLGRTTGRIT